VQTYVQSGNVVYATPEHDLAALGGRIEDAIERGFGFRPPVIQRTAAELREVIRANPFPSQAENEPGKLIVMFLAGAPGAEARDKVLALKIHPELLAFGAREIYIYFPQGVGQSKLPNAAIERALQVPFTGRNWNSVTTLAAMAEQLEAGLGA
jgi:uncharacterized protein (DUF1697 family)